MNDKNFIKEQQAKVDEERNAKKILLDPEDQQKHQAVEEALALLAKHKIMAYIYADVPDLMYPRGIPHIHQYNTIGNLSKYDENGSYTSESGEINGKFNAAMLSAIVDTTVKWSRGSIDNGINKLNWSKPEEFKNVMNFMIQYMVECIHKTAKDFYEADKLSNADAK